MSTGSGSLSFGFVCGIWSNSKQWLSCEWCGTMAMVVGKDRHWDLNHNNNRTGLRDEGQMV